MGRKAKAQIKAEANLANLARLGLSIETLNKVKARKVPLLPYLKMVAVNMVKEQGFITVDDIRDFTVDNGIVDIPVGIWGGVFKGRGWRVISHHPSRILSNKGRVVTVWGRN